MSLFQFLIYAKTLSGVSMEEIAGMLFVTRTYLSAILSGRRPLSMPVRRRAAKLLHCKMEALEGLITERDARLLARSELMRRAH